MPFKSTEQTTYLLIHGDDDDDDDDEVNVRSQIPDLA
jgi:hypothetical protein